VAYVYIGYQITPEDFISCLYITRVLQRYKYFPFPGLFNFVVWMFWKFGRKARNNAIRLFLDTHNNSSI